MDFDGEEWIITRRTKTRVSSNVPLMEIAKELIERYRGLAGGDLVFPMPSNSVCNTHLKQIAKACGIHKEIGFHLSRHTFATTVYLCNGGTIEALSKILGHKHISTTQIYAEVMRCRGVAKNAARSLCVLNETLYYLSPDGVMAWDGSGFKLSSSYKDSVAN